MYTTFTYTPTASETVVLCVTQSGATSNSCWVGNSLDSGATYTKLFSAMVPATYIASNGNLLTDYIAALGQSPTPAQTAASGYILLADLAVFMYGGAWLCSS